MSRARIVFLTLFFTVFLLGTVQATPVNWALTGTATQSTTYNHNGLLLVASNAIDNNTGGNYPTDAIAHTNMEFKPWWEVDLGSLKGIDGIDVWNRTDSYPTLADRLFPFTVSILDAGRNSLWSTAIDATTADKAHIELDLTSTIAGQFVRLQLNDRNYLNFAELQVWGDDEYGQNSVPEPATMVLFSVGLLGVAGVSRRKK